MTIDKDLAKIVAEKLDVTFDQFTLEEFTEGINIELEHGFMYPEYNVTNNDLFLTAKIALAHLHEHPNYYNPEYGLTAWEKFLEKKLMSE